MISADSDEWRYPLFQSYNRPSSKYFTFLITYFSVISNSYSMTPKRKSKDFRISRKKSHKRPVNYQYYPMMQNYHGIDESTEQDYSLNKDNYYDGSDSESI